MADTRIVRMEHGKANALDPKFLAWFRGELSESDGPLVVTGRGRIFSAAADHRVGVPGSWKIARTLSR